MKVLKRDGLKKEDFDKRKIERVIKEANNSLLKEKRITNEQISELVAWVVKKLPKNVEIIEIEEIQNLVEESFVQKKYTELFRVFRDYRKSREKNRFIKNETVKMMEDKYSGSAWDRQNANIDGLSFDGKAGEAHAVYDKEFALNYMITPKFAKNHRDMVVYIHDLDSYKKGKHNCLSFPIDDYRDNGMSVKLKRDIRKAGSVSSQSQLAMMELQSQSMPQFGGVSLTHWDSTLVPLAKKDYRKFYKKNYERITGEKLDDSILDDDMATYNPKAEEFAMEDLRGEIHQSMEGLLHNANTLQSRSGNQLPFTSINFGADNSSEGRLVTMELLKAWEEGIGDLHLTPIFPCGIYQYKKDLNDKEGTPNYETKKKAIEVLTKRDYPNFTNSDWSVQRAAFKKSQEVKKNVLSSMTEEELKELVKLPNDILVNLGFTIKDDGREEIVIENGI